MKNFVKLSKNEMKMVLGGFDDGTIKSDGGDCDSDCTTNDDCTGGKTCKSWNTSCTPSEVKLCAS